jgi:hypothetical protein
MKAPMRVLSFVMALSFTSAMMPQVSAQSQPATSALSPATHEHNSLNRVSRAATSTVVGGRATRHSARPGRRPHRDSWWNVIG